MLHDTNTVAWHCKNCGRFELPVGEKYCPDCGEKMQRCSRYEWFLSDAIRAILAKSGVEYKVSEQYELPDHRGFTWYFDLYVWVKGKSIHGGYGELIEVNGKTHDNQKIYSGAGGGYTRDYDKRWEVYSGHRMHKSGIEMRKVNNELCAMRVVSSTASEIVKEIIERSNSWL